MILIKFPIPKDQILKQVKSTFEKRDVLCRQALDTVYTQINAKRKSINKAKNFIKDNHQEIQDYFFSLIKDKDVVNKVQNKLKKNAIMKNVIERGDKYINHYIEALNKSQNNTEKTVYKAPPKKASSSQQKIHLASRLKPSTKRKTKKTTSKKIIKRTKK